MTNKAGQQMQQPSVSIVTPGTLPLFSHKSGSVETVATHLAQNLAATLTVRTYGITDGTAVEGREIGLTHLSGHHIQPYLANVITHLRRFPTDIVQVENRPQFMPQFRQAFPQARLVLTLHSLSFLHPTLLHQSQLAQAFAVCDTVVANSDFLKREVQALSPPHAHKVKRIHLGVNPYTFRPNENARRIRERMRTEMKLDEKPTVLFVGRLLPQKGAHILLTAMEHVCKRIPNATLVVVGGAFNGSKMDTPYVKKLKAHPLCSQGNIRFISFVPPRLIPTYYSVGDVFVTPSIGKEAFGLVNVEAMASGLPVVAHDVGGIGEIVEHGKTGYLSQPGDVQSLADSIVHLLVDDKKRKAFGKAGRRRVELHFTWDNVAASYKNLYNHLISSNSK